MASGLEGKRRWSVRAATSKHVEVTAEDFILTRADGAIVIPACPSIPYWGGGSSDPDEINISRELTNGTTHSGALKTYI